MKSIRDRLLSGDLEASDFKIIKYGIEKGKIKVEVKIPGVTFTKFRVDYFGQDRMVISYRCWGIFKRHILNLPFKRPEP